MAQISIVRKSQLEGAMRLDAEYYQPKYLEIARILKQQPKVANVGSLCKLIYRYPSFYNLVYQDHGVLVLKGEDIDAQGVIDNVKADHISRETSESFPKTILKKHDLIISVRGYVGKTGLVDSEYEGAIISPNLIRLEVDSSKISPVYLWVFLNSRYGNLQIARAKMQTSQETIVSSDIKNMLVPLQSLSFQTEIENIVEIATKQGFLSKSLYLQAEQLLLDELGFKDVDLSHQLYWTVPFKKTREANRLDAEHFQPKYERLIQHIQRFPYLWLRDVTQTIQNGKTPAAEDYSMEGMPILKVGGLRNTGVIEECFAYVPVSWAQANTKGAVKQFDALVLCAAHLPSYIGKTGLLMEDLGPLARAVGELIILRFNNKVCPEFVCVYLNLGPVRLAVQRLTRGNTAHLYPDDLSTLPIPLLPSEFQQRIADLVTQSWEARQKAGQLLEEAKNKVENLIGGKA